VYADVLNICLTYTPSHAWCSTTPVNACRLSAKMHTDLYIYIHMIRIYMYTYTCIHVYTHIHIHTHTYTHTYIHGYIHMYICIYMYRNIYIHKMHMHSCMCAYATVQHLLCHGSYCELILSLARTLCRLSSTARPPPARPPAAHPSACTLGRTLLQPTLLPATLLALKIRTNPR